MFNDLLIYEGKRDSTSFANTQESLFTSYRWWSGVIIIVYILVSVICIYQHDALVEFVCEIYITIITLFEAIREIYITMNKFKF